MGIWDIFRPGRARGQVDEQRAAVPLSQLDRLDGWTVGRETESGVVVSEVSALQVSTVMACVQRIALDIASMPIRVQFENADGSVQPAARSRQWSLLTRRPNPNHTPLEFFFMLTAQAALYGEAFAYLSRSSVDDSVVEMWPLSRREVSVERVGFEPTYHVSAYEGQVSGRFTRRNILHLRPTTFDGQRGLDKLLYARNAIGLSQAAQLSQARSFKNGNRMPGYWTSADALADSVLDRLEASLQKATTGTNQFKSPLLDNGIEYKTTGQTFDQAQMIETRKHEMIEVCAAFGVLPAVLGIDDKTTAFASVEAMFTAHIRHTLRPWLTAWEQTLDRDLLDGLGPLRVRFDTSDMEKATTKERAESYRALMETLTMTPNEARALEGRPKIDGLDELWIEMMRGKSGLGDSTETGGGTEE